MSYSKTIIVALALVAITLGGCADEGEAQSTDPAPENQPMQSMDDNTPMAPIFAGTPTALLIDAFNGTAPLLVNFTIEGSSNATWSLDFGNGANLTEGEGLPANAQARYDDAGNFTAVVTVIDGTNVTTASQNIAVRAGSVAGELIASTEWTGSGFLLAGVQGCGLEDGVDYAEFIWDASALAEGDYALANIVLEMFNGETTIDLDFDFITPDGANVGHAGAFEPLDGNEKISGGGPYPAGEFVLQVSSCSGAAQDFEWVMTADIVTT